MNTSMWSNAIQDQSRSCDHYTSGSAGTSTQRKNL